MTAMAKALRLAKKEFFNINPHPNPNRPKRVLLVTDGKETEGGDPVQKANRLKNKGVEICVVGIGNNINEDVLKNIATEYYIKKHGFKWEPCYVEAEDWIEYKRKMRKAFRLLKKLRKGKGN